MTRRSNRYQNHKNQYIMTYKTKRILVLARRSFFIIVAMVVGLATMAALLFGVVCLGAWGWEKISNHFEHYTDEILSSYVSVEYYPYRHTYRLYDNEAEKFLTPHYDGINTSSNKELVAFQKDLRYGFLDPETGEVVIEPQYSYAECFDEGIAPVVIDNKRVIFINRHNEKAFEGEFDYSYSVLPGYEKIGWKLRNDDSMVGIIDRNGAWVIKPEYQDIDCSLMAGFLGVMQNDKWGVLNAAGELHYPIAYDNILANEDRDGFILQNEGLCREEDMNHHIVRPFIYDVAKELSYKTNNEYDSDEEVSCGELLSDFASFSINDKQGVFNRMTGEVVLPALYDNIYLISSDLIEAYTDGYWQTFDSNGKAIEP